MKNGRAVTVAVPMMAEITVAVYGDEDPKARARLVLDAFREASQPSHRWAITLYEMSPEDPSNHRAEWQAAVVRGTTYLGFTEWLQNREEVDRLIDEATPD